MQFQLSWQVLLMSFSPAWAQDADQVTVYVAKNIITMDPGRPNATAVAVRDGHILAVGSEADMKPWTDRFPYEMAKPDPSAGHDVPVGMFLSGGIDSSLIAAITARQDPQIEGYTIVFRDEDRQFEAMPDDASYARRFAAQAGITLHEIEIAPNVVELLPQMVEILDEPIGDPAAINTLLLCQASREAGVKVMLSGMGADELFGGYRRHLASTMATTYRRLPRTLRQRVIEPALRALPVASARRGYRYARWAKRFGEFASLDEEAAYQRSYSLIC